MTELAAHAIQGPPSRAAAVTAGLVAQAARRADSAGVWYCPSRDA